MEEGRGKTPTHQNRAERRLRNLQTSKYFRDSAIKKAYGQVFVQWEEMGYVREVQLGSSEVKHLLAHFPIIKVSSSTPVRPVMDCSTDLNQFLLSGPNLLNDVAAVLLRFRSGLFTYAGDVSQMFLQIFLREEDRPYHCFLWEKEGGELMAYQFQVHVFGNTGSPFVAVFVVKEHAKSYQAKYPAAVETLCRSTLIDDVLDSADTLQEARDNLSHAREILADAGMKLVKLHSNRGGSAGALPGRRETKSGGRRRGLRLQSLPPIHSFKSPWPGVRRKRGCLSLCTSHQSARCLDQTRGVETFPRSSTRWGCCCPTP